MKGLMDSHLPPTARRRARDRMRLAIGALVLGLALHAPTQQAAATTLPDGFGEVGLSSGALSSPTAAAFAPDGRKFVAEKKGRVWVVAANGAVLPAPLLDIRAKVNDVSDRGLLGIAADKDFESADSYYEIRLTVTDTGGLEHTTAVDVRPRTSELTLASSPAGAPLE